MAIALKNEWFSKGEYAERYLKPALELIPLKNGASSDLLVVWHKDKMCTLLHDRFEWYWRAGSFSSRHIEI
ncbi:hypothetical protein [Dyadobacter frigoris]|uniref:Uncharacterized protein n=1 Tax=Dyadobacter frigoris TaxID=2576211 RepID=A0A4U6CR41_9BACT|nr:hypothetical protein [Dyadobacter frigoris]TKT87022.1 hypothetical protein FDK13_30885 [Dyadobacter frigoris]